MLNNNNKIHFWSGIMRDHTEFILLNLSSNEFELISNANYFKEEFTKILNSSRDSITISFIDDILVLVVNFIEFKKYIMQRLLTCNIHFNLTPSFINHMINEACEFLEDLENIKNPKVTDRTYENIKLHKIWLPDTSGHASALPAFMDGVETFDREESLRFAKDFNDLFIKANELGIMLDRTSVTNGALKYLNEQVRNKVSDFIYYLSRLKELTSECKLLGNLIPSIPDHMIREAQYYLSNIQELSK